ncbi:MAG TPA: cystathionine beta-lyase [Blastocatellia bacterium]|jgi:cystathionine beta-lyase|nr:cystathionine beta-lyase [Blastocatellia bacterium]
MKISTQCVHFDSNEDPHCSISPPIYQTATFRQPAADEFGEYDYTRSGNPTRSLVERQIARLEGAEYASTFASGMAAISALTRLLEAGEEVIAGDDLYGGTVRLLDQVLPRQGIGVRYVDPTDVEAAREALNPRVKLILIESPSNPTMRIADIRALAGVARAAGALLAVDNSMLSPCFQKPLELGADIVVHSATKFLCGHSDVTAGALVTNDYDLHRRIAFDQNAEGAGLSPFESWLLLRGMKTLSLRVERQNESARKIAEFLSNQPEIQRVYYPGLAGHPGRHIHRGQSTGDGAVISFTTGNVALSRQIVESTQLFDIAVSFGSIGSTISLPCRMSHASIPQALRDRLAPPPDLVRVSVGIEDVDDLIEDLSRAFAMAEASEDAQSAVCAA